MNFLLSASFSITKRIIVYAKIYQLSDTRAESTQGKTKIDVYYGLPNRYL
jgi:hypothetical protein